MNEDQIKKDVGVVKADAKGLWSRWTLTQKAIAVGILLVVFGLGKCAFASGTATLSWTPPTQNTDGSPLTNLAAYDIFQATTSAGVAQVVTPTYTVASGVITFTTPVLRKGTYYWGVKARNSSVPPASSDFSNLGTKVIPNSAPTITGTPLATVSAGAVYAFAPTAVDTDLDSLTYTITNRPAWMTFSTVTGVVGGTAVAGTYTGIVISVSDGTATTSLPAFSVDVTVQTPSAPVLTVQ